MAASKRFYVDRGLAVAKSFGRKYVEFATPSSPVKLALYARRGLAKDAGVSPEGTGSHRLVIGSDAGPFTDPDGFAWEAARTAAGAGPAIALASDAAAASSEIHRPALTGRPGRPAMPAAATHEANRSYRDVLRNRRVAGLLLGDLLASVGAGMLIVAMPVEARRWLSSYARPRRSHFPRATRLISSAATRRAERGGGEVRLLGRLAWPHCEMDGTDRAARPGGRVAAAAVPGSALPRGRPVAVHAGRPAHHGRGGVPGVRADPLVARCRARLARAAASADRRGPAGWLPGRRGRPPPGAPGRAAADAAVQRRPGGQRGHRAGVVAVVRPASGCGGLHGRHRVGHVGDPAEPGSPLRGGRRQRHVPGAVPDRPGGWAGRGRAAAGRSGRPLRLLDGRGHHRGGDAGHLPDQPATVRRRAPAIGPACARS